MNLETKITIYNFTPSGFYVDPENAPFVQSSVTKSLLKIRRNKTVTILMLNY
mgnify:CR=1 FL=1